MTWWFRNEAGRSLRSSRRLTLPRSRLVQPVEFLARATGRLHAPLHQPLAWQFHPRPRPLRPHLPASEHRPLARPHPAPDSTALELTATALGLHLAAQLFHLEFRQSQPLLVGQHRPHPLAGRLSAARRLVGAGAEPLLQLFPGHPAGLELGLEVEPFGHPLAASCHPFLPEYLESVDLRVGEVELLAEPQYRFGAGAGLKTSLPRSFEYLAPLRHPLAGPSAGRGLLGHRRGGHGDDQAQQTEISGTHLHLLVLGGHRPRG